jgi:hypothetical protein
MTRHIRQTPNLKVICGLIVGIANAVGATAIQRSRADEKPAPVAQAGDTKNELKTVELAIHPALPPYAALRYRLLPQGIETTPGDAAPNYFRAAMVWSRDPSYQAAIATSEGEAKSRLAEWLELPLDQLRKNEKAQKFFNGCPTGNWDLISLAARRERCEWDLPIRETNIATMIPELQKLRDLARLLAFKARVEMSRGQIDSAIETLKTGMAMGRHAAQAPTLINALVGVAITRLMLDEVRELIQQPNCPNLYWTLTAVPDPVIDLRTGMEFEGHLLYLFLPELRDVRTAVHTEAEWNKILFDVADKLVKVLPGVGDQPKNLSWYGMGAVFAVTAYPKAKAQLADAGYSAAKIDAMCAAQAILTAEVETFEHLHNESFKWFYADSATSLNGLADAERNLLKTGKLKQEIIPLVTLLLPAFSKVKSTAAEADRYVAALRLTEAIRLFAAENHDRLPATLSDIKTVPVPNDPITGKPFDYDLHDGTGAITSPSPPGSPASHGLRWDIRLAPKK